MICSELGCGQYATHGRWCQYCVLKQLDARGLSASGKRWEMLKEIYREQRRKDANAHNEDDPEGSDVG